MSNISYNARNMQITVDGLDDVARALGELKKKTPAVTKVALNATAREARKLMIAKAKARYAVNAAGQRHIRVLKQTGKATNSRLVAELYIKTPHNDLGYFETSPSRPYMGGDVANAPEHFRGHVLKDSPMKKLEGKKSKKGKLSKGFLLEFKSGHIGMVQRVIGSEGRNTITYRSKRPRWRNKEGKVEKLLTMGSPSATAMHNTIWPDVEPDVERILQERLNLQVQKVLARAAARTAKRR